MTTLVDSVATRIDDQVAALKGAVQYIADLASLIAANAMPQREVSAFVVPLGFDGGEGQSAVNAHTQMLNRAIGVVLAVKALGDATAQRAPPKIDVLEKAVLAAVAGWAPDSTVGVFNATKGRLVSIENGLVLYQIDFALKDQLRNVA
jgi:hypothetical protein